MDYGYSEKKKVFSVGRLFKWFFIALILFVYGFFMLRICSMNEPTVMRRYWWTQEVIEVYNASPATFNVAASEPIDAIDDDGLFSVSSIYRTVAANQLQLTVRYNNSTVKKIVEAYALDDNPTGEAFVFILRDENGVGYPSYYFSTASKFVHNYRKIVFDGIDFATCGALTLEAYYIEDVDLSRPMASYRLLTAQSEGEPLDNKLLGDVPAQPDNLHPAPAYLVRQSEG